MLGTYRNVDRKIEEPELEAMDAIMLTLDAEQYLEKTLDAVYREVPIKRLYVIDGGSRDNTVKILRRYPRTDIQVRPDIKTTGKGTEMLFKMVTTEWCLFVDVGKVPTVGWYDEMLKHKDEFDFYGSKRINHFEFEREDKTTTDYNKRPLGGPWLIRKLLLNVGDDYMWRVVDLWLRQEIEEAGGKYGFSEKATHICYISDGERYKSDKGKNGVRLRFKEPEVEILNKENYSQNWQSATAKAVVKYLDPEKIAYFCNDTLLLALDKLDKKWIKKTSATWYGLLKYRKRRRYLRVLLRKINRRVNKL